MAKSGINALVRHVASKWGKQGHRANAVAPGFLMLSEQQCDMVDSSFSEHALAMTRSP
jgi:NAD(P)-dependent dehydrogenase (short-subunit alcohol dehydrogenase family)